MTLLRRLSLSFVVGVLLLSIAAPASAVDIAIAPSAGSQLDTFSITGEGLPPGLAMDINFRSPGGTVFSTAALNQVVVVSPDGDFEFSFTPLDEFTGERLGAWLAQVCVSGTDDCVQTTFRISG